MRMILVSALIAVSIASAGLAENAIKSAPIAAQELAEGEIILLDIRSPGEWKQTGLAKGAWPVSMHTPDFGAQLQSIFEKYRPDQVALICATGGRTAHVIDVLAKNGITGLIDVSEGMHGNAKGPGWIARGMPVVTVEDAKRNYDLSFTLDN